MRTKKVYWFGLMFVLSSFLVACSGAVPSPQAEEPKSAESVVSVEPTAESAVAEEPTVESAAAEESTVDNGLIEIPQVTGLPVGETAPDFTLFDGNGNKVNLAEALQENEQVVLVFYYSDECSSCMSQLFVIEQDRAKYEEKGALVIAIAVQSETDAALTAQVSQAHFPILADENHTVTQAYGVLDDRGLSSPSVFIINRDREIAWSEITYIRRHFDECGAGARVPSFTILKNLAPEVATPETVVTEEPTAESVAMEEPDMPGLPVGETAPEFSLIDGNGNTVNLEEALQENEQVVLVFYFGVECAVCMTQLKEIEKDRAKYEESGAQVMAIAVQVDSKAAFSAKVSTAQFPILADIDHAVTEAYGVLDGRGRSNPSVFIIDKDGQIVWSEITHIAAGCGTERVPSQTILENLG